MRAYLIDTENVSNTWKPIAEKVEKGDKVYFFYTVNSQHLNFDIMEVLSKSGARLFFEKCNIGTNALDFQMISYLGFMLKSPKAKNTEYVIVSNDKGYDPAINFWKNKGFTVSRAACETALAKPKESTNKAKNIGDVDIVLNCIGSLPKGTIHDTLVHIFSNKKGDDIYSQFLKNNYAYTKITYTKEVKIENLLRVVFTKNGQSVPASLFEFIESRKCLFNNKTAITDIREPLISSYGEKEGMAYYKILKTYRVAIKELSAA